MPYGLGELLSETSAELGRMANGNIEHNYENKTNIRKAEERSALEVAVGHSANRQLSTLDTYEHGATLRISELNGAKNLATALQNIDAAKFPPELRE